MTSSKYIQLNDKILMEFEYFNPAESTSSELNEYQIQVNGYLYETVDKSVKYLLCDTFTDNRTISKIKASNFTVANSMICNANVGLSSARHFASRNDGDPDIYYTAQDYMDSNLDEYNPPERISSDGRVSCDKVKIYFASSYSTETNADGLFGIEISTTCKDGKKFILGSYILNEFECVPNPFLIGERLYSKMIEFYIPSVYENRGNLFGSQVSLPATIDIALYKLFNETESVLNVKRIKVQTMVDVASVSISAEDQYATVYASIEEIDDYFILEGRTKNTYKTFVDFISDLPGTLDDYILMHDITVNELVTNTSSDDPDWKITTHHIITQTDNFDEPTLFRPVIKYSNCIACVIDYTLRIYCNSNNTQIIKRATSQNFNFSKYGKKLIKINLGTIQPRINIYNKLDNSKIDRLTITNTDNMNITMQQESIFKTSYITTFRDRMNIKASISPVKIDNILE